MTYKHCASGILESSKKDPALTDLHFMQIFAGHSKTNPTGVFCLSLKPSASYMHIHAGIDQECENALKTLDESK